MERVTNNRIGQIIEETDTIVDNINVKQLTHFRHICRMQKGNTIKTEFAMESQEEGNTKTVLAIE